LKKWSFSNCQLQKKNQLWFFLFPSLYSFEEALLQLEQAGVLFFFISFGIFEMLHETLFLFFIFLTNIAKFGNLAI
jgi:hypothetical protein